MQEALLWLGDPFSQINNFFFYWKIQNFSNRLTVQRDISVKTFSKDEGLREGQLFWLTEVSLKLFDALFPYIPN